MELTDLTAKELSAISFMCTEQIESLKQQIAKAERWLEGGDILDRVIAQDKERLTIIREFHVQVLGALEWVKMGERISSN